MRIISGKLGGRTFNSPRSHRTHPMSDRVRGALFNTLGDIEAMTVLDAFAGSGAIGFEAVSRGAKSALLIEHDKLAQLAIADSIASLELQSQVRLIKANCSSWSDNNPQQVFDLVILDPPYDGLRLPLLQKLANHTTVGGIVVLSWPGRQAPPELTSETAAFETVEIKDYGDAQLIFYRRS